METKQPTQEQIREFWKWCGLKEGTYGWLYDSKEPTKPIFPPLDLNNLFRYAINNLDLDTKREVLNEWIGDILVNPEKDIALSLFGVINAKRNIHKN